MQGYPKWMGRSEELWQKAAHWRREWQTIPAFLPLGPHELYEMAKQCISSLPNSRPEGVQYATGKSRGQLLIALERTKRLGQSRNDAQLWMCLVMKVKSNAVWERVKDREAWHAAVHGVAKNQTLFSDWTMMKYYSNSYSNAKGLRTIKFSHIWAWNNLEVAHIFIPWSS